MVDRRHTTSTPFPLVAMLTAVGVLALLDKVLASHSVHEKMGMRIKLELLNHQTQ